MKGIVTILTLGAITLTACQPSPASKVSADAVADAGIISTMRSGDSVTLLYQSSSTTQAMLQSEANRACSKIGKSAGNSRTQDAGGGRNIPGVDSKIVFTCF